MNSLTMHLLSTQCLVGQLKFGDEAVYVFIDGVNCAGEMLHTLSKDVLELKLCTEIHDCRTLECTLS